MIYDTYNDKSSLFPNQSVQGRDSNLYRNEDVPVMPRRYHEKLRDGEEGLNNKKRIYPPDQYPDLYKKDEADVEKPEGPPEEDPEEGDSGLDDPGEE